MTGRDGSMAVAGGRSAVRQKADDFGESRKSAEVGRKGTVSGRHVIVPTMTLVIREMRDEDARAFLEVLCA
jgi:hypothetical protein